MADQINKISIIGPQGSGKGTQAKLLSQTLGIPTLSVGQMLRDEVEQGGEYAKKIQEQMKQGNLVPNSIIHKLLVKKIKSPEFLQGYILDGFPRIRIQAKTFETVDSFTHVLVIWISDEVALARILNRRAEAEKDPQVKVRADDMPKAIKERLEIFHADTEPVIDYFKEKNIVYEINGEQPIEQVHQDILEIFKEERD